MRDGVAPPGGSDDEGGGGDGRRRRSPNGAGQGGATADDATPKASPTNLRGDGESTSSWKDRLGTTSNNKSKSKSTGALGGPRSANARCVSVVRVFSFFVLLLLLLLLLFLLLLLLIAVPPRPPPSPGRAAAAAAAELQRESTSRTHGRPFRLAAPDVDTPLPRGEAYQSPLRRQASFVRVPFHQRRCRHHSPYRHRHRLRRLRRHLRLLAWCCRRRQHHLRRRRHRIHESTFRSPNAAPSLSIAG